MESDVLVGVMRQPRISLLAPWYLRYPACDGNERAIAHKDEILFGVTTDNTEHDDVGLGGSSCDFRLSEDLVHTNASHATRIQTLPGSVDASSMMISRKERCLDIFEHHDTI